MLGKIRITNSRTDGVATKVVRIGKGQGKPIIESTDELPAGKSRAYGDGTKTFEAGDYHVAVEFADGSKGTGKATVSDDHEAAVTI